MSAFADAVNAPCSVCNQGHIHRFCLSFALHAYRLLVSETVMYVLTFSRKFVHALQNLKLQFWVSLPLGLHIFCRDDA